MSANRFARPKADHRLPTHFKRFGRVNAPASTGRAVVAPLFIFRNIRSVT